LEIVMPVCIRCPSCKSVLSVDDAHRGKQIRCGTCSTVLMVPTAIPSGAVSSGPPPRPAPQPAPPRPVSPADGGKREPARPAPKASAGRRMAIVLPLVAVGGALAVLCVLGIGVIGLVSLFSRARVPGAAENVAVAEADAPAPLVEPPPLVAPAMEGSIPVAVLQQIKDASVFVKMDAGPASASGSGFLMRVDGDNAYFATNDHVVTPKSTGVVAIGRLRPRVVQGAASRVRVSVVVRSGTTREQTYTAEVVAADPDADLAILRVVGARDLPQPIDFSKRVGLVETMPVYIFGFPFGQALAARGNPAITVGKGSVSSLRRDKRGDLDVIQINGDLNPGNSGGPIVDAQGRLIGVAVASIRGTQIGMAIPAADLTQLLAGRALGAFVFKKRLVGNSADVHGEMWVLNRNHGILSSRTLSLRVNDVAQGGDEGEFEVEAKLLDPLRRITRVGLIYVRSDQPPPTQPNQHGLWDPLLGAEQIRLKIENQKAVGGFNLPPGTQPQDQFAFQLVLVNGAGQTMYTQPRLARLNFNPGMVAGGAQPPPVRPANPQPGPPARPPATGQVNGRMTQIMGGAFDPQFQDEAPPGGVLIGFNVGLGQFINNDIIAAVQPIYRTAAGEVLGKSFGTNFGRVVSVKAKDGYAVGGITAKAGLTCDGFSVTFMRVAGETLNPADAYQSQWIGGRGGGQETFLGGGNRPIVGIVGKANNKDCTGLGLLLPP
jgi:predicted Zn finger-like uncharacterized protein